MSITQVDRTRVSLAAAISMILAGAQVNAQEAQKSELEEVVVTGSFIRGTPEDSAMPVEVVSFEEIQNMGRPSNLDLIKTMSESGGVAGENNRVNFYPIGAATINLRSLGSRFTTVVFNGRRFPEQFSVNTGRFNNIAWIPNAAIGSVETLKAGGGATYGADAVAGVVNYVTRKNFEGLELNADYRYIEDSDGDYNADMLWGHNFGAGGDMLVSLSYQHRSTLHTRDRDWYRYSYLENYQSWQSVGAPQSNPGSLIFTRPVTGSQVAFRPTTSTQSQLQQASTGTVRDVGCAEMGGFLGWSTTPTPGCYTNTAEMEDLVSEQNTYTLYLEHNVELGGLKFHTEALGFKQDIPEIALGSTFVSNLASYPLVGAQGAAGRGLQTVEVAGQPGVPVVANTNNAFYVPGYHPAVANLLNNQLRNANGTTAFSASEISQIINGGRVGLQANLWKPFGNGGTPRGDLDLQEGHLTMYRLTEAIGGNLPEFWGTSLEWEIGLTYGYIKDLKQADDIPVDRLQAALNGFGGPNCSGTTPGANGCEYFNPFSSAIAGNVFTGVANPYYVPGLANSRALVDWLYEPIWFEREYKNYVVDPIIRGDLGINLPGGPIAVAFGGQFRRQDERVTMDRLSDREFNPCPTFGVTDCATAAQIGPYVYNRQGNVFGAAANNYRYDARHYPVVAAFFETKLPLMSTLDVNVAGRYEKFFSDVTDIDNDVFVPAVSFKWSPLDWLGVRGSWGKTFSQVNPPEERNPIVGQSATGTKYTGLGGDGARYETNNYANLDVKPEKGVYVDLGLLFSFGGFSANIDYYDITIDDYTRQMTVANVLDAVSSNPNGGPASSILMNCSSGALTNPIRAMDNRPLLSNADGTPIACTQGVTTMQSVVGKSVNYFAAVGQTNSGELKTKGIDFSARYRFDVGAGTITPSVDVSRVLKWELSDFVLGGVKVADGYDGLGYLNLSSGRISQSVAKFRANLGVTFNYGIHTLNVQSQYVPPIINEDPTVFNPSNSKNANLADANGFSATGGTGTSTCRDPATIVTDLGHVPNSGGTGQYATGTVGGTATTPGVGSRGFCAANNATTDAGHKVKELINVDLVYRVELPAETSASLVVGNVFDKDPSFYRGIVPYNTAYGSPLGRTFKLGVTKRF